MFAVPQQDREEAGVDLGGYGNGGYPQDLSEDTWLPILALCRVEWRLWVQFVAGRSARRSRRCIGILSGCNRSWYVSELCLKGEAGLHGCLSPPRTISDGRISAGPKREELTPRDPRGLARKICPNDRPVYPAHSRTDLLRSGKEVEGSLLPPSRAAAVVELASSATRGWVVCRGL